MWLGNARTGAGRDRSSYRHHDVAPLEAELGRAYERGRSDERGHSRTHPLLLLMVLAAASAVGGMVYLASEEGSFSKAGEWVDNRLSKAGGAREAERRNATRLAEERVLGQGDWQDRSDRKLRTRVGDP